MSARKDKITIKSSVSNACVVKIPAGIKVFNRIADFRQWRRSLLLDQKTLGYVPTMGALHPGHLALGNFLESYV
jgi:pantoate--beta-alanine ligase